MSDYANDTLTGFTSTAPAHDDYDGWRRAALLKDRTRRAIRSQLQAGDSPLSLAEDFQVPLRFIQHLAEWQLFKDRA